MSIEKKKRVIATDSVKFLHVELTMIILETKYFGVFSLGMNST